MTLKTRFPGRLGPNKSRVERRRRQAPFPTAGERFRTSYADSPVGLALLCPDGAVFHANPALCRLLETNETSLHGTPFTDLVTGDDLGPAAAILDWNPVAAVQRRSCSARLRTALGTWCWVDLTSRAILDREGAPLLIVVHVEDRTAEVEAVAALAAAERVAQAGLLASGVVHDVRNALAALQGRVEMLADDLDDEGAARDHLHSMNAAMARMSSLTSQVLDLARPASAHRELVDLAGIVKSFEPVARAQFDEPERLEVVIAEPVLLEIDPAQIERVLLTLFSNAVDAVVGGGSIRIEVGLVSPPGDDGPPRARLVVADTGQGMDDNMLSRAFVPFCSTKGRRGIGLGLASARTVVESAGGTIGIVSERGVGTTVEVVLPAVGPSDDD